MPVDLPEPRRPSAGRKDPRAYRELCVAFLVLAAIYSLIHKALIPGFLYVAAGKRAALDLWFLHPWLLYLGLRPHHQLDRATSFLAGVGIAHGVVELVHAFEGAFVGWAVFSHLLSALPVSFVCVFLLTGPVEGRNEGLAWAGAVAALALGAL